MLRPESEATAVPERPLIYLDQCYWSRLTFSHQELLERIAAEAEAWDRIQ